MRRLGQVGTQTRADISAPDLGLLTHHSPVTSHQSPDMYRVCLQAEIMPKPHDESTTFICYMLWLGKIGIEVVTVDRNDY